jgi:hypothetical protein
MLQWITSCSCWSMMPYSMPAWRHRCKPARHMVAKRWLGWRMPLERWRMWLERRLQAQQWQSQEPGAVHVRVGVDEHGRVALHLAECALREGRNDSVWD